MALKSPTNLEVNRIFLKRFELPTWNLEKVCKKINGTLSVPLSTRELGGGMLDHLSSAFENNQELNMAKVAF
jgi:hypothetical protein